MNEAKQMHDDLLNALLLVIPRTTYQDIRRLSTLAWAITGLCLTQTVRLGAWAQVLESRAESVLFVRFPRFFRRLAVIVGSSYTNWMLVQLGVGKEIRPDHP